MFRGPTNSNLTRIQIYKRKALTYIEVNRNKWMSSQHTPNITKIGRCKAVRLVMWHSYKGTRR
jgi:hypothetical protein